MTLSGPAKMAKGLRHLQGDDVGKLRHTRKSEMGTEVRAQNLAHSEALRKQLNEWYKEQHVAVHKLSLGQQKMFKNLIKVQNEKRRIQRQTHIKKQEELRQKLRERAQKQKEEALKKAMEMNMLSLAIENRNQEEEPVKKSPVQKLPKIQEEIKNKDEGSSHTTVSNALASKRKREVGRRPSLEFIETKRPTRYTEKDKGLLEFAPIKEMNKSKVLPSIQNGINISTSVINSKNTDLDIIAAVSEANEVNSYQAGVPMDSSNGSLSTPHFTTNRHRSTKSPNGEYHLSETEGDEETNEEKKDLVDDKEWNPGQSRVNSVNDSNVTTSQVIEVKAAIVTSNWKSDSNVAPDLYRPSASELPSLEVTKKAYDKNTRSRDSLTIEANVDSTMNSNQVLPPIGAGTAARDKDSNLSQTRRKSSTATSSTHSTKNNFKKRQRLKERQSLIDDMHRYHVGIANRRHAIPDYAAPVVDRVVKYTKNSQGSFVSSDISVKPAAEDFKLPSKKSAYMLQKALKWEQGQVQPRQFKLDHFYGRVSEHIDNSKKASIPRPYISQRKDPAPVPKLEPTVQSRTFGISLEAYHLERDVNDIRNTRYLRFKGTDLLNNQNDADLSTLPDPYYKGRLSSWKQSDLSYARPKLNTAYPL